MSKGLSIVAQKALKTLTIISGFAVIGVKDFGQTSELFLELFERNLLLREVGTKCSKLLKADPGGFWKLVNHPVFLRHFVGARNVFDLCAFSDLRGVSLVFFNASPSNGVHEKASNDNFLRLK